MSVRLPLVPSSEVSRSVMIRPEEADSLADRPHHLGRNCRGLVVDLHARPDSGVPWRFSTEVQNRKLSASRSSSTTGRSWLSSLCACVRGCVSTLAVPPSSRPSPRGWLSNAGWYAAIKQNSFVGRHIDQQRSCCRCQRQQLMSNKAIA
jgi:hypothetical protein